MQKQSNVPKLSVLQALGERLATAWRLFVDPRVPLWAKALPVSALVYVLWPMDVLADVIPGLGQLDDLTILVLAIEAFIRLCPDDLWPTTDVSEREAPDDAVEGSYQVMGDTEPPETMDPRQIGGGSPE
ncbi:MAG: YkvA family protein [Anaerolineae bacterium]